MAYYETNLDRIKKLISNPQRNINKIIPFLKSRLFPYKRDVYEFFGQDKYSKPYLGHDDILNYLKKRNGFFVQCGGSDGYGSDPTYFLEKFRGWTGIIVEPTSVHRLCQKSRKKSCVYNYAAVPFGYEKETIPFMDCYGMSIVKDSIENQDEWLRSGEKTQQIETKEILAKAKTIQKIIDEYFQSFPLRKIDLFVADVEGYEINVLKGLDFEKNPPNYLLIEICKEERKREIDEFLFAKGYKLLKKLATDDFLYGEKG